MRNRYDGKPFLRLLDSYVLWAVGQLGPSQAKALEEMAPKLREAYGRVGSWQEIVAAEMAFPEHLPGELRALWGRTVQNVDRSRLDAVRWAQEVVDANLV